MVQKNDRPEEKESRPPSLEDFLSLCRDLNESGAKYLVIGGMAVIQKGLVRATEDIDLLVDSSVANVKKIKTALEKLPDRAVLELDDTDIDRYEVVRVADEIVVDLLKVACGVSFEDARTEIEWIEIQGVKIPFASTPLLLRMKQGIRPKDQIDRAFLETLLRKS